MAEEIELNELTVEDDRVLALTLSRPPSGEWEDAFAGYWRKPASWGTSFRKSVFQGFNGDRMIFANIDVEDFTKNHKAVVEDGVRHANQRMAELEAARAAEELAAREENARRQQRIMEERQRASEVTFRAEG